MRGEEEKQKLLAEEQQDKEKKPQLLKFQRVKQKNIYFKKYLDDQFKHSKYALPENIRLARNVAIILSVIELICCIASVGFYIRRRSKVILAIIIFAFVACLWGAYAKIRLSYWGLFGHAAFTIAVMGGFFIYLIVEMCYGVDQKSTGGMSETAILILLSLPFLLIFAMGIYSLILLLMIDSELEERRKTEEEEIENRKQKRSGGVGALRGLPAQSQNAQNPQDNQSEPLSREENVIELLDIDEQRYQDDKCVICCDKEKNAVFYPCGHQIMCMECSEEFKRQARHQVCPVCRYRVVDIIRVYRS